MDFKKKLIFFCFCFFIVKIFLFNINYAKASEVIVDGSFTAATSSAGLRNNDAGQDWYESRAYSPDGPGLLTLDETNISGNSTKKAKLTANTTASSNTYLTQALSAGLSSGDFVLQWDTYIDSISNGANSYDNAAWTFLGYDDAGTNGPNSRDAERWAFIGWRKDGGGTTGTVNLVYNSASSSLLNLPTAAILNLDQWYTIAIIGHTSFGTYDLYVNGMLKMPGIIAKIEKPDAVKNMDEIIAESDGIMVARGDLGVELPLEQVPLVQKKLIRKCNQHSKPIIVATQMMEGMISNIRPTRAEVNDVANSVLDGADAVMLSGETSVGLYPQEVVETMQKIIWEVEQTDDIYNKPHHSNQADKKRHISDSVLSAACNLAIESNANAIIAMTITGYSAQRISSQRPKQDMFIFTGNRFLLCRLNLVWGIRGFYFDKIVTSTTKTFKALTDQLIAEGRIKKGDLLIKVASTPIYVAGQTNTVKLDYA